MTSHRRDPYLWLHLAGLATVPLWLDACLVGLAVGEPIVAPWLEITVLLLVGSLPIVWMQLRRPFYIFSVPGLALRPDKLSLERRRLLAIQRGWWSHGLVILMASLLCWALYWLYQVAPMALDVPWLVGRSRATGWVVAAGAFLLANLFALVSATVLPMLTVSSDRLAKVEPWETTRILPQFMVLGLRISKILPEDLQVGVSDSESLESPVALTDISSGDTQASASSITDAY